MNNLKEKLSKNELTLGSWITLNSCENAEVMGQSQFDWLTVDTEHSAIGFGDAQQLIRTIQSKNLPALVRVGENDATLIKRTMDAGADGVIVPMVKTKEDAQRAVAAVKYPPEGSRGVGFARAQGYGLAFDEYKKWLAEESIVIAIIEHVDAMDNLEEILSVEGLDATMIGPYDLSGSIGCPGEVNKSQVVELVERYKTVCQKLKKPAGYHVVFPDANEVNKKVKEGFRFLAFGTDALFLGVKVKEQLEMIGS